MLQLVVNRRYDNTISINFIGSQNFNIGDRLVLSTGNIKSVTSINSIVVDKTNETKTNYFSIKYRYRNNKDGIFTNTFDISTLSALTFNDCYDLEIEFHIFRVDENYQYNTPLTINGIFLEGTYIFNTTDTVASLSTLNEQIILKPKDIYKIFKLTSYEVISEGSNNYSIKYRITQNEGRTYLKDWEELTTANLSTAKIDPLRFAKIEYLITNNSESPVNIYDIMLIGDFQNVSANYLKLNRYGLKEDCLSYFNSLNSGSTFGNNFYTNGMSCYLKSSEAYNGLLNQNNTTTVDVYKSDKITLLNQLLTNSITKMRGWMVDYYRSSADENGIDYYLHEQTLSHIAEVKPLRIIIKDNKFANETYTINIMNLDLFNVFEIYITKDEFKAAFGIEKRPRVGDIIYICQANMLYRIKHTQAYRGVMNAATYYQINLEKHENDMSQLPTSQEVMDRLDVLMKDNSMELFTPETKKEDKNIANKKQFFPLSFDNIRNYVHTKVEYIDDELVNGDIVFSKAHYKLSKVISEDAIIYSNKIMSKTKKEIINFDNVLKVSDNRHINIWFNIPNKYDVNKAVTKAVLDSYQLNNNSEYELISNCDVDKNGYRLFIQYGKIVFMINNNYYELPVNILTNVWYNVSVMLDNRNGSIVINLMKRNGSINIYLINSSYDIKIIDSQDMIGYLNLLNAGYKPMNNEEDLNKDNVFVEVDEKVFTIDVNKYEFNHDGLLKISGSEMKITNLRIFNDIIEDMNIMLSQEIIVEASKLIIADNTNKKLITTNYITNNFR